MRRVGEVKNRRDLLELVENLIVARHVRGQDAADHTLTHLPELLAREALQDVALRAAQYPKRHRAVVVF